MSIPYTSFRPGPQTGFSGQPGARPQTRSPATLGQVAHRGEAELVGRLLADREAVGIGPRRVVEDRLAERLERLGDGGLGRIGVGAQLELEEPGKAAKVVGHRG